MAPPLCVTHEYRLTSMAARFSSAGLSHHDSLPHVPLGHLSAVNNSPRPGIVLLSLGFQLPAAVLFKGSISLCRVGMGAARLSDSHSIWDVTDQLLYSQPQMFLLPGKNTGVGCHFLLQCMKDKSESEVAQSCLTLCDPLEYSLPGSSAHGIF